MKLVCAWRFFLLKMSIGILWICRLKARNRSYIFDIFELGNYKDCVVCCRLRSGRQNGKVIALPNCNWKQLNSWVVLLLTAVCFLWQSCFRKLAYKVWFSLSYAHINNLSIYYKSCMFHRNNLYTVDTITVSEKLRVSHLECQLLDKYLTFFLTAVFFMLYLIRAGRWFCDRLVQFHILNAVLFQKCLCLTVFFRYANSSLIKYMEKHKVKPDSKVFLLVSTTWESLW